MSAGWTRVLIGSAVMSFLLGAGAVIAVADTGGVIFACVNNSNGNVRIVAQQVSCKPNETAAHWNVVGPQGPPGPQGPAGPQGPPGQSGPKQQVIGVVTVTSNVGTDSIEAIEFTSGITVPTATAGGGTGAGAGKATLDPATFTKVVDKTSPDLFRLAAAGTSATAKVELCNSVTTIKGALTCVGTPYAIYQFENAHISKIATTSMPLFNNTVEVTVTIIYPKIIFTVDGKTVAFDALKAQVS